jgi:hypothetical protein
MPRRSGRTSLANSVHTSTPELSAPLPPPTGYDDDDLCTLRTNWKWAAFSQFITTFSSLLNMADLTVNVMSSLFQKNLTLTIPFRTLKPILFQAQDESFPVSCKGCCTHSPMTGKYRVLS